MLIDALLKLGIICMIAVGFFTAGCVIRILMPSIHQCDEEEKNDTKMETKEMPKPKTRGRDL